MSSILLTPFRHERSHLSVVYCCVSTTLTDCFQNFVDDIFTGFFVNTCDNFIPLFIFQSRLFIFDILLDLSYFPELSSFLFFLFSVILTSICFFFNRLDLLCLLKSLLFFLSEYPTPCYYFSDYKYSSLIFFCPLSQTTSFHKLLCYSLLKSVTISLFTFLTSSIRLGCVLFGFI